MATLRDFVVGSLVCLAEQLDQSPDATSLRPQARVLTVVDVFANHPIDEIEIVRCVLFLAAQERGGRHEEQCDAGPGSWRPG